MAQIKLPTTSAASRIIASSTITALRAQADLDTRIYPLRAMRLEVPDYAVYDGFPSSTPQALSVFRATTSASGQVVSNDNLSNLDLGATKRWIASVNYNGSTWLPINPVTNESYYWSTGSGYGPEQIIREWSERVSGAYRNMSRTGLSFPVSSYKHMWASFPIDTADTFMLTLVVDPYDTTSQYAIIDTGTATPLSAALPQDETLFDFTEPIENRVYLHATAQNNNTLLKLGTSGTTPLKTSQANVSSEWPVVIAIVGRQSALELYTWNQNSARPSSNNNSVKSIPRTRSPYSTQFLLGRSNGTIDNCGQMTVFDVGFWESAPSQEEVINIMSRLRTSYQIVVAA